MNGLIERARRLEETASTLAKIYILLVIVEVGA
jgi:hypothetical protein